MLTFDDLTLHEQLKCPFDPKLVSWRVGNTNAKKLGVKPWEATEGSALAYIDARDVMLRLDTVVGFDNWQTEYLPAHTGVVICRLGLRLHDQWLWKSNGAGETDVEGEKGACSDAFKRAAVLWGIGQYLYRLPFTWTDLHKGRIINTPSLPKWATPEAYIAGIEKKRNSK